MAALRRSTRLNKGANTAPGGCSRTITYPYGTAVPWNVCGTRFARFRKCTLSFITRALPTAKARRRDESGPCRLRRGFVRPHNDRTVPRLLVIRFCGLFRLTRKRKQSTTLCYRNFNHRDG